MNDLQNKLRKQVAAGIAEYEDLKESDIDNELDELKGMKKYSGLTEEEVEEVRACLKSEHSISLKPGSIIIAKGHKKWFLAKKPSLEMKYWERYKQYLMCDKGFSVNVVNKMDDILDKITDLLGDPTQDESYKRRGLIIGDVQSGKTANYTGMICKAVDTGYKVVVLLTGTIEKLRQQTQQRIDEGFVGTSSDNIIKQKNGMLVGVGKYDASIRPMVLTSVADDFKAKNANNLGFNLKNINGPVIFVLKKNVAVLKRLNKWLKDTNGTGLINHSLLLIDDESDNASVNTKNDPEESPTAINGQIRLLLQKFIKSSYVGFTATPFANIFIDPDNFNDMVKEDLFPKDFIYSLDAPSNYTGARNIFGPNGKSRNMLRFINEDEKNPQSIASILPLKHKADINIGILPEDMETAIASFFLANTIEDLDGLNNNHRSMLINVSRYTRVQDNLSSIVRDYVKNIQTACKNYGMLPVTKALENKYIAKLKNVYEEVYGDFSYEWEIIQNKLHNSCAGIIVQTFNRNGGQNVSYDSYPNGLRIIAVGGMSLSRGLTLEGLVISYFYRNSKMYDTLMQMGRWFGYRNGYDKLCKIWMSTDSINWYTHISQATDELRADVKKYEDSGLTPIDFGLRVRSDITSLLVTARNKMRSTESRECVISLSGVCIETPEIYADEDKNQANLQIIRNLVNTLHENGIEPVKIKDKYGFRSVDVKYIIEFLNELNISPKNEEFNTGAINNFVKNYTGDELKKWDVFFITGKSNTPIDMGNGIKYNHITRSFTVVNEGKILKISGSKRRLGNSSDGKITLRQETVDAVESLVKIEGKENPAQKDYFIHVAGRNPLLLIYAVELKKGDNLPECEVEQCMPFLGKVVYGFGIGIPKLSNEETKYARYILNKVAIQQIFEGEIDEWEADEVDD